MTRPTSVLRLLTLCAVVILIFGAVVVACAERASTRPNVSAWLEGAGAGPGYFIARMSSDSIPGFTHERAMIAAARWCIAASGARNAQRSIPILSTIEGGRTALLVIDMQRVFLDSGAAIEVAPGRAIIPSINRLAAAVRAKGGKVIFFRYLVNDSVGMLRCFEARSYLDSTRVSPLKAMQPGNPQFELRPDLDIEKGDTIMDKTRYSAVLGSSIVEVLRKKGIENVIVTGVTTDVCAGNTAEDLMQMDFHVVMVWDGCAALDRLEHELYLARIFGLYGDVMPTVEVIARLK
jgi:ureidoacrylate peracid hydrolase